VVEYEVAKGTDVELVTSKKVSGVENLNLLPQVNSVIEGEMKCGHFEGFTRSIDSSGRCQVGYYSTMMSLEEDRNTPNLDLRRPMISRPFGKVMKFSQGYLTS
jgi:hypothetical protein